MSVNNVLLGMKATLGDDVVEKVQNCQILCVGAGGIGCELIKNLALTGFRNVQVIDLDTIDVSNLNRQLLFRSQHVGKPKCHVACEVAKDIVVGVTDPSQIRYIPHHGNVCNNDFFNVNFVQQFDLVLNALDNITARRRVNRICLAAKVPLIEAGTTGYLGQVNVIDKDSNVACYECQTQETPKVYPICTIRSTPSMPVHTIVWAKELYKLLFGENEAESMLYEDPAGEEPSTFMQAVLDFRNAFASKASTEQLTVLADDLLRAFYVDEIQKQLNMDRYKTARKTPMVLSDNLLDSGRRLPAPSTRENYRHTDTWSPEGCIAEWINCVVNASVDTVLSSFDKDDDLSMRFVTAASNLRSFIFSIEPLQSYYSAKGIAGNIIPAIATTNAIAAGLQILQAFHVLKSQLTHGTKSGHLDQCCSYVNCIRQATRNGLFLTAAALEKPNPKCYVCRNASLPIALNTNVWTMQDLLEKIIKKELGFEEPTLMLEDMIWEEGEGADVDLYRVNLSKVLPELPCGGIRDGTVLQVQDFSQDLEVDLVFTHKDVWERYEEDTGDDDIFKYDLNVAVSAKPKPTISAPLDREANGVSHQEENDVLNVYDATEKVNVGTKRQADPNEDTAVPLKKMKPADLEIIEMD